jgi:hypothetical protein
MPSLASLRADLECALAAARLAEFCDDVSASQPDGVWGRALERVRRARADLYLAEQCARLAPRTPASLKAEVDTARSAARSAAKGDE